MNDSKRLAICASLCAMISVQSGASVAKHLFNYIGPSGAAVLRVGLAGLILALLVRPKITRFNASQWLCVLFYGLSTGAMNLVFYYGVQKVPLGLGVAAEFAGPLSLALLTSRKITDILWATFAATGIALIVPWNDNVANVDPFGLTLVILAGIFWALYIVAGRFLSKRVKNGEAVACGLCVAALFVLPFGIFDRAFSEMSPRALWLGLCVAILSSALPFTLDLLALKNISPKTFSVLQSLQPAFAALSGLIFLHETLMYRQWIAIFFVVLASIGAAWSKE